MPHITEVSYWTKNLGHLPVHLKPNEGSKYIMLNGLSGNFCLHTSPNADDSDSYFSQSWSSNTKNFLFVNDTDAKLYNWNKPTKVETISLNTITNNFEKFYSYLVSQSIKSDKDVVPIIIDIFKQFRTLTSEYHNPIQALNLLFILLAGIEDDDVYKLNFDKWGIANHHIPTDFERFLERFKQSAGRFVPDLNLILRHSAGALFQEAQKEVLFFDKQMDLFGTFSGTFTTKNMIYSSIHYTPSYLARTIVENVLNALDLNNLDELKILDPACGSGEFLIEVLKQLKEKNYQGSILIHGFDSSETAVNTSKFLLKYEQRTIWENKLSFDIQIVDDSLTENWNNDYSIILMNPPFISWEQLTDVKSKEAVKHALDNNFQGKPNQASAFFYKAVTHLQEGGVLGSVIPTSLFSLDAYSKLRSEVIDSIDLKLLGKLGNFVFEDALTDVSIFIGQKPKTNNSVPTLLWTRNEKGTAQEALRELRKMQYAEQSTKDRINYSIFQPDYFPVMSNNWKPISQKEYKLIKELELYTASSKLSKVAKIFDVKQGIRSGKNNIFKISKNDYNELPANEKKYFRLVVENESIKNGFLSEGKYIWYPYDKSGLLINSEDDMIQKVPTFFNKVFPYKSSLSNRARKNESNWWCLSEHRTWQQEKQLKLISTEFGNSSSFAIDKRGAFVVERGNAWLPKFKMDNDDYYFYLSLFSSPFFDKLLSIYSKRLMAAYDLGNKYTKDIPIPDTRNSEVKNNSAYAKMVELGKHLSNGGSYVKSIIDDILSIYYPQE